MTAKDLLIEALESIGVTPNDLRVSLDKDTNVVSFQGTFILEEGESNE